MEKHKGIKQRHYLNNSHLRWKRGHLAAGPKLPPDGGSVPRLTGFQPCGSAASRQIQSNFCAKAILHGPIAVLPLHCFIPYLPPQTKVVQVGDSFADSKEFLGKGKFFPIAGADLPLHAACNFIGRQPRLFGYDTKRFGNAALMVLPKGFYPFFHGAHDAAMTWEGMRRFKVLHFPQTLKIIA